MRVRRRGLENGVAGDSPAGAAGEGLRRVVRERVKFGRSRCRSALPPGGCCLQRSIGERIGPRRARVPRRGDHEDLRSCPEGFGLVRCRVTSSPAACSHPARGRANQDRRCKEPFSLPDRPARRSLDLCPPQRPSPLELSFTHPYRRGGFNVAWANTPHQV